MAQLLQQTEEKLHYEVEKKETEKQRQAREHKEEIERL